MLSQFSFVASQHVYAISKVAPLTSSDLYNKCEDIKWEEKYTAFFLNIESVDGDL